MAKGGIKTNIKDFTKKQQQLINDFEIGSKAGMRDFVNVVGHYAKTEGFNGKALNVEARDIKLANGMIISNRIKGTQSLKDFKNRTDKKKLNNRTGKLYKNVDEINLTGNKKRSGDVSIEIEKKGKAYLATLLLTGRTAKVLSILRNKDKKNVYRRPIETGMNKAKGLWRKLMAKQLNKVI